MELEDEKRYSNQHGEICSESQPLIYVIGIQPVILDTNLYMSI